MLYLDLLGFLVLQLETLQQGIKIVLSSLHGFVIWPISASAMRHVLVLFVRLQRL